VIAQEIDTDACTFVLLLMSSSLYIFTGSIARSAKRRYLSYSEADVEIFLSRRGDTLHRWRWNLAWSSGYITPI